MDEAGNEIRDEIQSHLECSRIELLGHRNGVYRYKAYQAALSQFVFIKAAMSDDACARLRHESEVYKALDGEDWALTPLGYHNKRVVMLVLPFMEIPTLAELMQGRRPSLAVCRQITLALVKCVASLHRKKISHRDIRPENVLVSISAKQTSVRLFDFEYAAIGFTRFVDTPGASSYQASGLTQKQSSQPRGDVFGLGAVCRELFFGRPHKGEGDQQVAEIDHAGPRSGLSALLQQACDVSSGKGFKDAPAFLTALDALKNSDWPSPEPETENRQEEETVPLGLSSRQRPPEKRRSFGAVHYGLGGLVLLLAVLGVYYVASIPTAEEALASRPQPASDSTPAPSRSSGDASGNTSEDGQVDTGRKGRAQERSVSERNAASTAYASRRAKMKQDSKASEVTQGAASQALASRKNSPSKPRQVKPKSGASVTKPSASVAPGSSKVSKAPSSRNSGGQTTTGQKTSRAAAGSGGFQVLNKSSKNIQ